MTMNQQKEPLEWGQEIAAQVGERVRMYRTELNLSAQNLANRTATLGYEVKRSVIAEMENGKRSTVSVADIFVLARALAVPPVALLLPLESSENINLLPGEATDVWKSFDWITGRKNLQQVPKFLLGSDELGNPVIQVEQDIAENNHWRSSTKSIKLHFELSRVAFEYQQNVETAKVWAARAASTDEELLVQSYQHKIAERLEASKSNAEELADIIKEIRKLGIFVSREYTDLLREIPFDASDDDDDDDDDDEILFLSIDKGARDAKN